MLNSQQGPGGVPAAAVPRCGRTTRLCCPVSTAGLVGTSGRQSYLSLHFFPTQQTKHAQFLFREDKSHIFKSIHSKSQNTFLLLKNWIYFAPICTATSAGIWQVELPHNTYLESNISLNKETHNQEHYQAFPTVYKPISASYHFFAFSSSWISDQVYQPTQFRNGNVTPRLFECN